jgi:hypothetical protein
MLRGRHPHADKQQPVADNSEFSASNHASNFIHSDPSIWDDSIRFEPSAIGEGEPFGNPSLPTTLSPSSVSTSQSGNNFNFPNFNSDFLLFDDMVNFDSTYDSEFLLTDREM